MELIKKLHEIVNDYYPNAEVTTIDDKPVVKIQVNKFEGDNLNIPDEMMKRLNQFREEYHSIVMINKLYSGVWIISYKNVNN